MGAKRARTHPDARQPGAHGPAPVAVFEVAQQGDVVLGQQKVSAAIRSAPRPASALGRLDLRSHRGLVFEFDATGLTAARRPSDR
jgi:hypothetical protein